MNDNTSTTTTPTATTPAAIEHNVAQFHGIARENDTSRNQTELAPLTPLPPAADEHPALVYLAGLAVGSRRAMTQALNAAANVLSGGRCDLHSLPWHRLRYQHTAALRAWLLENVAPATANKALSAVRGVLRQCWQLGTISTEDYMRAIAIKPVSGQRPDQAEIGRQIAVGERIALLRCCAADRSPAGVRDAVILGLGLLAGLRREEIARLEMRHYDASKQQLIVTGKRNKVRIVPVAPGLDAALDDWLALRGCEDGLLLLQVDKAGRIRPSGVTPAAIYNVLRKRARQAGVKAFSPHDLRRTFAGDLLDAGADIVTVQQLMGHADVRTTARYDRRGGRAKREAIGRLHMAWEWEGKR